MHPRQVGDHLEDAIESIIPVWLAPASGRGAAGQRPGAGRGHRFAVPLIPIASVSMEDDEAKDHIGSMDLAAIEALSAEAAPRGRRRR